MDPTRLEARVAELANRLDALERRLAGLERNPPAPSPELGSDSARTDPSERGERGGTHALPWIGQTLLILGGAFLLRSLTDSGALPRTAGTALGLAYAGVWIATADWAASRERRESASFRGLAAVLIGFPLIWEATVKFGFLSATLAVPAAAGMIGFGLFVAWRRRIRALAWTLAGAAIATTVALALSTGLPLPFLTLLLLLGLATLWIGYSRGWLALAWLVAGAINFIVLLLTVLRLSTPVPEIVQRLSPDTLWTLQLTLVLFYFGSIAARTLMQMRNATLLEIGQVVTVCVIGFGGALAVAARTGASNDPLGLAALVLAAGCYAAAFSFIDRRLGRGRNFILYGTLALALTLTSATVLLSGEAAAIVLAVLSVAGAWVGSRWSKATLAMHGAIYAVGAAIFAGVWGAAGAAWHGGMVPPLGLLGPPVFFVIGVTALTCWFPASAGSPNWTRTSRAAKGLEWTLLFVGGGGLLIILGAEALSLPEGGSGDRALLATLRTAVLSGAAVLFAWIGRSPRLAEASWLVYPILGLGGIKLIAEDLRTGSSLTLFGSLALFGLALMIAPMLMRHPRSEAGAASSPAAAASDPPR